ncbi:type I-E CRISPR-associated protein Cse2/CasB [Aliagarivorans taiwanensis]|uniref:type I-E CRISPR-associated protein Cse2/CasB n=1 Tax=Aliagarivorans taiwanensis TaxID=561966 RepID=UPI0003F6D433|nr:type I-E CRISPR-associated protein Cse2/CasB [Aliagarivorans taiwanensis]
MDRETAQQGLGVALHWWKAMHLSAEALKKEQIKPAPSAWKAELKRCESPDAILLTQGFRALWLNLGEPIITGPEARVANNMRCWAMVAAALTFVTKDSDDSFARLAGKNGQGDKPVVSEMRFAQLQQSQSPEEFVRCLRRILQQLKGEASVARLVEDICQWYREHTSQQSRRADKRIVVRWAMDYYQAAQ